MSEREVRVKICGITDGENARVAVQAGADAVGLNLVAGPRMIDVTRAVAILGALPEAVEGWALLDATDETFAGSMRALLRNGRLRCVQLYGTVTPETLGQVADAGLESVAVRHVSDATFAPQTSEWLRGLGSIAPGLILLDAVGTQLGGTGRTIPWELIADARAAGHLGGWPPIVLAGGLRPGNVAGAISAVRPAWVDVSSGVESSVGVKDAELVRSFVEAARVAGRAD